MDPSDLRDHWSCPFPSKELDSETNILDPGVFSGAMPQEQSQTRISVGDEFSPRTQTAAVKPSKTI